MPKRLGMRRKPRRKTRKTTRRKPRSSYNRVARTIGFPDTYPTKLRYVENYFPAVAASGTYNVAFTNSLVTPRTVPAGGHHQPLYFDQMALIYGKYRVYGFKYVIQMVNVSSDKHLSINVQTGVQPSMDTSTETAAERIQDRDTILGPQKNRTMSGYVDVAKVRGVSKAVVRTELDYSSLTIGSPGFPVYLKIMIQNPWATSCSMHMKVEITYYTKFFERINVAGSVV